MGCAGGSPLKKEARLLHNLTDQSQSEAKGGAMFQTSPNNTQTVTFIPSHFQSSLSSVRQDVTLHEASLKQLQFQPLQYLAASRYHPSADCTRGKKGIRSSWPTL